MPNGAFLGGFAEGVGAGRKQQNAVRALDQQDRALGQGDIRQQQASRGLDLESRGLDIREKAIKAQQQQDLTAQADKHVGDTLKLVGSIIKESQAAGKTPEQIRAAISPLVKDISDLAQAAGRDPQRLVNQIDAIAGAPVTIDAPKDFRVKLGEDGKPVMDETGRPVFEPLPGGPKDPAMKGLPAETAGRLGAIKVGIGHFPDIVNKVKGFGAVGSPQNMRAVAEYVGGFGNANQAKILLKSSIEGVLRALTGAAAPESEVQRIMGFYAPTPFDREDTRQLKLDLLSQTMLAMAQTIQSGHAQVVPLDEALATLEAASSQLPDDAGDGSAPDPLPQVSTPEEARQLPSGTRFRDPDGKIRMVP